MTVINTMWGELAFWMIFVLLYLLIVGYDRFKMAIKIFHTEKLSAKAIGALPSYTIYDDHFPELACKF